MNRDDLAKCLDDFRKRPWPRMAGEVGEFPLYESLIAGCADRVLQGSRLEIADIPEPDLACAQTVATLRAKHELTSDEAAFVGYFDALQDVRDKLLLACQRR